MILVNMTIFTSTLSISSKDVRLPIQLQRAMAAEAEATREARAKVRTIKEASSDASESDDDHGNHDRTLMTIDNLYNFFVDTDDFDHIVTDDFS